MQTHCASDHLPRLDVVGRATVGDRKDEEEKDVQVDQRGLKVLERWREEQEHREDGGHNAEEDVCEARVVVAAAVHLAVDAPELQSKGPGSEVRRDEDASSFTDIQ